MKVVKIIFVLCFYTIYTNTWASFTPPNRTYHVSVNTEYTDYDVKAEVGVWYKDFTTSCDVKILSNTQINTKDTITKPFIIVEGFDIGDNLGLYELYDAMNGDVNLGLLEILRRDGWDIIIVNLQNNTEDIRANAKLFEKILSDVEAEVKRNHTDSQTPIYRPVVMGISMGGLVVRYCLTDMENRGIDPKVEKYLSFDSPHKGANVPLGFQHFSDAHFRTNSKLVTSLSLPSFLDYVLDDLDPYNWMQKLFDKTILFDVASAKAAMQMSMMSSLCEGNASRTEFTFDLAGKGNYPKKCRMVGIANGASGVTNRQPDLFPRAPLLEMKTHEMCISSEVSPLISLAIDKIKIKICPVKAFSESIYAMPGTSDLWGPDLKACAFTPAVDNYGAVFQQKLGFEILPEVEIRTNLGNTEYVHGESFNFNNIRSSWNRNWESKIKSFEVDHVAGGYYDFGSYLDSSSAVKKLKSESRTRSIPITIKASGLSGITSFLIVENLNIDIEPLNLQYRSQFSFVPTVSSLAINTTDWEYDVASIGLYPHDSTKTPFDAIHVNSRNSLHAFMDTTDMVEFMLGELSPENLYIQNRTFEDGYEHTFESRKFIALGKNVDLVPTRTKEGNVLCQKGSKINLSVPYVSSSNQVGFVYFDDGFDSGEGDVEVIFNRLPDCDVRQLTVSTDNTPAKSDWSKLRKMSTKEPVSHTTTSYELFNEAEADAKHRKNLSEEIVVYPNPTHGQLYLRGSHEFDVIRFFDLRGRLELTQVISSDKISVEELDKGFHLYEIVRNGTILKNGKLVVK